MDKSRVKKVKHIRDHFKRYKFLIIGMDSVVSNTYIQFINCFTLDVYGKFPFKSIFLSKNYLSKVKSVSNKIGTPCGWMV